jgi:hypothetical protein
VRWLVLMTTLPILGKHPCRLWPGCALEVNTFAGHDGGNRHSASSPPECISNADRQTRASPSIDSQQSSRRRT